jgi:phosphate transport system substrate-binding protein
VPRSTRALLGTLLFSAAALVGAVPASAGASHAQIAGSGSSWSSNAVNQWVADVQPNGLQVVFTASGSAIGRKDYANKTTDFAVSDIGFQGEDKLTGESDTSQGRNYVYLPIVAGGTAFPYQLKVGGKLVRNLRLSGTTVAKIFTNQITNWNDPAVAADNNGRAFPSKPIIPVVHSEGSGSSAQLTKYFDDVYPSLWRPFFGKSGFTEYFPHKGGSIAQNGSDGVMNYVASDAADGAIGYDEYSYALGKNFPVAKLQNSNGFFTLPTQYNVAVALTDAHINSDKTSPNYLLQDLHDVYRKKDDRAYALSSYSYMIIPTASNDSRMVTAKRQTLADYLYYSICEGQKEVGPIGSSPLPIHLAQSSFEQISKLKSADPNVDLNKRNISTCGNPTFVAGQPSRNYLAEIAPQPAACDKTGAGPCGVTVANVQNPGRGGSTSGGTSGAGTSGSGSSSGGGPGGTTGAGGGSPGGTTGSGGLAGSPEISGGPAGTVGTGSTAPLPSDPAAIDAGGGGGADLAGTPTELASSRRPVSNSLLGPLAVLLLLAAVVLPPLLSRRLGAGPR